MSATPAVIHWPAPASRTGTSRCWKSTQLSEITRFQFRAEFFNILNHTNLQLPNEVVYSAGPTQGTTANQNTAAALGSPGVISATANTSRQIQLGLKLLF